MPDIDNKRLINLIRYAPVIVVFVFALAVDLIAIQHNREQAAQSIKNLREELTFQRKDSIRSEVHQVYSHLLLEKSKIESDLKEKTKQRVYEAYGIANHIYAQNLGKSKTEISKLIIDALRPVRFFDGRGYFFILANDGKTILNGPNAYLEGPQGWDLQDEAGHQLVQNMLYVTKNNKEGFVSWRYKKPDSVNNMAFEKIGYIKKFEPYDWSIATGEYLSDFELDVKTKLLKWFSDYEYGENGYFFVLDKNGKLLAHHVNDFLGLDFVIGKKVNAKLLNDINAQINKGGGYIHYSKPLTLSGKTSLEQLSYVKEVKEWGWIIGTAFSAQAFEKHLRLKEKQLVELNHRSLMHLIYLTIVSMILLTASSLYVSNLIARRFEMFKNQIKNDFNELNTTKDKMEYMALHDALTDLPNRVLMLQIIKENIQSAMVENEKLAIMFVDLDNFKNVNDLYGHHVGDLLLRVVSQRFKGLLSTYDSVSRLGGDEFVFCFTKLPNKKEAEDKAKLVLESLVTPITIESKPLFIGCSIGVSMFPDDGSSAETLIGYADTVLYKSKADKKGQVLFYSSSI
ncbi:MAG: cache domain-containing protein, partial [Methylophilus sp.]